MGKKFFLFALWIQTCDFQGLALLMPEPWSFFKNCRSQIGAKFSYKKNNNDSKNITVVWTITLITGFPQDDVRLTHWSTKPQQIVYLYVFRCNFFKPTIILYIFLRFLSDLRKSFIYSSSGWKLKRREALPDMQKENNTERENWGDRPRDEGRQTTLHGR